MKFPRVVFLLMEGISLLYATPIIICGSYILANNCRKNSVSFDGRTNLFFSSKILDVFFSNGVESFIGNLLLRSLFLYY